MNLQFRSVESEATVSVQGAAALRSTFGTALSQAGASPTQVTNLQNDMDGLVDLDSNAQSPTLVAANDYALILQTALGVGRPIRTPSVPSLSQADDTGIKGDHITSVLQPHLVGTYDPSTTMSIIDQSGNVLGSAAVATNGQYSVQFAKPLTDGTYFVRVQATDQNGDTSLPSRVVKIIIRTPVTPASKAAAAVIATTTTTTTTPSTTSPGSTGTVGF